jgi:hypothetical protein
MVGWLHGLLHGLLITDLFITDMFITDMLITDMLITDLFITDMSITLYDELICQLIEFFRCYQTGHIQ